MSKEHLEQFMKQVADSKDLRAKIGAEITGDVLVALGAAHGFEFSIEELQAGTELSDVELEGVSGGTENAADSTTITFISYSGSKPAPTVKIYYPHSPYSLRRPRSPHAPQNFD